MAGGRVGLALGASWPTDLRPFQPWIVRLVAGWAEVGDLPATLVNAVGIMTAHYATAGRDVLQIGHIVAETPYGYADAIAPYTTVTLI